MKVFDPKTHDFRPEDREKLSRGGKAERAAEEHKAETLDDALEETFPASDPPSITTPKKAGPLKKDPKTQKREEK